MKRINFVALFFTILSVMSITAKAEPGLYPFPVSVSGIITEAPQFSICMDSSITHQIHNPDLGSMFLRASPSKKEIKISLDEYAKSGVNATASGIIENTTECRVLTVSDVKKAENVSSISENPIKK